MNIIAVVALSVGIIATSPEKNPEGKLLTMREANIERSVFPQGIPMRAKMESLGIKPETMERPEWLPADSAGIVYGASVSRNEFGIDGGLFPSPDGRYTAFYRKDESAVTEFPLLDITSRTGSLKAIRYPMNGLPSEHISLGIHDNQSGQTVYADVTDFTDERYLTNVSWSLDCQSIFIQVVDREQHHMHLNLYNAASGSFKKTILTEQNAKWIEPLDPVWPLSDKQFIYRTDNRHGYRNLYLCDLDGKVERLTKVDADVAFVGIRGGWIYYTSAEVSPVENHLFRIKPGSRPQRLTTEPGWHKIVLGEDAYIDSYSSVCDPGATRKYTLKGKLVETLVESDNPLKDHAECEVQFGTVKSADGTTDNYFRFFKPLGFDPAKKYPLIVYVYGGPHSQMVQDSWLGNIRMWEMYMAQRGYAVYVQDNRGTQNRGAEFEKAINRQCGQAEMEDQIAGLQQILEANPWIDAERIGVHGWSYGGFMTITLATNHPEIFKVAVAGGPVIDWKWYEVMYGERYMDTPQTNPEGFERTSLLAKAKDLQSKLLICQGAIDDTVVWEHSLSFVQECINAQKQVEYFPFPKGYHNMRGMERVYLYQKITDYFTTNL